MLGISALVSQILHVHHLQMTLISFKAVQYGNWCWVYLLWCTKPYMYTTFRWHLSVLKQYNMVTGVGYICFGVQKSYMYTTFRWHLSVLKQYNMVTGVGYICFGVPNPTCTPPSDWHLSVLNQNNMITGVEYICFGVATPAYTPPSDYTYKF